MEGFSINENAMRGEITAYKHFDLEVKKLRRIYLLIIYSFEQTRILAKTKKLVNPANFISFGSDWITENTKEEIDSLLEDRFGEDSEYFLHYQRLKGQPRRYLRDMILIYLVAQSEVFLWNLYVQIYEKIDKKLKYNREYLLEGGGLDRAKDAYRETFNLKFGEIDCNFERVKEVFARRHLITHNGGKISDAYKESYKKFFKQEDTLKSKIHITPGYILGVIKVMTSFSFKLTEKLSKEYKFTFSI